MRWFHWVNFPMLAIMIWSGILIYWASDTYYISIIGHKFHFFPESFYKFFNITHRLAEGMAFHFLFMWFFAINGVLYVLYTALSGEWRNLVPNRHSFKEAWLVLLHDLRIRKAALPPQGKYNAAQRIAYSAIIIMGLGSLVTGLAIYKPVQFYWLCWLCGGYHFARIIHFALTIGYVLFFVIHVVQVILSGWNNFRSVISGFEIVDDKNKPLTPAANKNEKGE